MTVRQVRPVTRVRPRRVAMLSVHTSPLDQAGTGDAGGLNVYVAQLATRLAAAGTEVEVFTRATSSELPPVAELAPGVLVRHLQAGPYEGLSKDDLPGQLCALTAGVLRAEAAHEPGWYDLVHSHYWLSGQVGWLAKERWAVPLVHSMHTMAKVKNLSLADGESPEPVCRAVGEEQVVVAADRLVANTDDEARQLVELYAADPARVRVISPGVDLGTFSFGGPAARAAARAALGLPPTAPVLLFVGRIQPHKAPDVLLRAVARLRREHPQLARELTVAVVGGPSGSGLSEPEALHRLAGELGLSEAVRFAPPVPHPQLAQWYRAADLTCVPSYSESFGLVAIESQACGTPVVAAAVGGLRTAVRQDVGGVLVDSHDPGAWAAVLAGLLADPQRRARLAAGARQHAAGFGWATTTALMLEVYAEAITAAEGLAAVVNQ